MHKHKSRPWPLFLPKDSVPLSLGREGVMEPCQEWCHPRGNSPSTHSSLMQQVASGWKGFSPPVALRHFQEQPLSCFQEPQLGKGFPLCLPPMHDISPSCSLAPCSLLGNKVRDLQRAETPLSVPVHAVSGICVLGVLVIGRCKAVAWVLAALEHPVHGGTLCFKYGVKKAKYWEEDCL